MTKKRPWIYNAGTWDNDAYRLMPRYSAAIFLRVQTCVVQDATDNTQIGYGTAALNVVQTNTTRYVPLTADIPIYTSRGALGTINSAAQMNDDADQENVQLFS